MNRIAFLALLFLSCQKQQQTFSPAYQSLTEAVYASGNIKPINDHQLFAEASGYLVKGFVGEGEAVKKGQPIVLIASDQQQARTADAQAAYSLARQNAQANSPILAELLTAQGAAKAKMQNDSINFVRYQRLWEQQATSKTQYEKAQLAYQLSKAEWERLQSQLVQTRNRLQAEQSRAEAQLRIQASEQGNYQVLSDTDGMLFEIYRKEGELVRKGEPIALLGSADNCYLQLSIDELDIAKIKIGQEVLVAIDIYPDQFFKANIAKIYPLMNAKEQAFRVDAQFQSPFKPSFAGLNVEANIIIQKKEKALTIPKRLVSNDSVWVLDTDGKPQRAAIKKGLENMEFVEIVGGLSENSQLVEGQ